MAIVAKSPFNAQDSRWRHYRIDCVLAIIDQAKFIKHAISYEYENEEQVTKYINELHEMVTRLKEFAEEK